MTTNNLTREVLTDLPFSNEGITRGLSEWNDLNLPPKELIYNFDDGNEHKIIYKKTSTNYSMLTFTLAEDGKVYFGNSSYGRWYFSTREALIGGSANYYTLTKEGISAPTIVGFNSSSANYLPTTYQMVNKDYSNVLFTTVDIYDSRQETIVVPRNSMNDINPLVPTIYSLQLNPDVRIKVGESWKEHLVLDASFNEGSTFKGYVFDQDYPDVFEYKQSVAMKIQVAVHETNLLTNPVTVLVNIHEDDTTLSYPNSVPFPIEDGMKDFLIFKGKTQIGLVSHTGTDGIHPYLRSDASIQWFDNHPDGGYGATCGAYLYYLNKETNVWEFQSGSESRPYQYPLTYPTIVNGVNDIIFSTKDVYGASKSEVVYQKKDYLKQDYHVSMQKYDVPYDLPPVKPLLEEDGFDHYLIAYTSGYVVLTTLKPLEIDGFELVQTGSSNTQAISPSSKLEAVKYRRYNPTTGEWGSPVSYTNVSSFNNNYLCTSSASTLTKALTTNDMVIYTTLPIYLKRSVGDCETLLRYADNRVIADENSVPPVVTDVLITNDPPYSVDTVFDFAIEYELEVLDGVTYGGCEWSNKQPYYPSGDNQILTRIKDSRGLWSEWFEKTFTVDPVLIPDEINIDRLPTKPTGEPYQHYFVAQRTTSGTGKYFCFAADCKEGIDTFYTYAYNSNSSTQTLLFNDAIGNLFEVACLYVGYSDDLGWGSSSYLEVDPSLKGLSINNVPYGIHNCLASNVYLSTFPIYTDRNYTDVRIHPINEPKFPLTIAVAASHENVWTSDDVTVTTHIVANGHTWHDFKYRINNGAFIPLQGEGDLTFTESGDYHVEFFIYNQNNVETKAEVFFKIDKENPVLSIEETESHLIFKAIDEHSGIQQFFYRLAESSVFVRSRNFAQHTVLTLDNHSSVERQTYDWIPIEPGFKLAKPTIGGIYPYQLMAVDRVGNTHLIQYDYNLPIIPIEQILVTPDTLALAYQESQSLSVEVLPANHNEVVNLSFESDTPYFTVTEKGLVKNVNGHYGGLGIIKVRVNQHLVEVPVQAVIDPITYPPNHPSLYDLHHYTHLYTDFIIAQTQSGGSFDLIAFNREMNDAIFYLESHTHLHNYLAYTIDHTITEAVSFKKSTNEHWNRVGTNIELDPNRFKTKTFSSQYPHKCIVFSTVDIYSDETGTLLAYPKDVLPETHRAHVWIEPNPYPHEWVNSLCFTIHGEDRGDGLNRLTYSLNNETEVEVENGGIVVFPHSGIHTLQAFAYNNHQVQSATDIIEVKLDLEAPTVVFEAVEDLSSQTHQITLSATDEHSGLGEISYRRLGGEWLMLSGDQQPSGSYLLDTIPYYEHGRYRYEALIRDVAGNEAYQTFDYVVEKPIPSEIVVTPSFVELHPGDVQTLSVEVKVLGVVDPSEIIFSDYDENLILLEGHTIHALAVGNTSLTVSCREVSTTINLSITPSFIPVESLVVKPKEATLEVGDILQLETAITPHDATDQTLTFVVSEGQAIASVTDEGLVTALTPGQAVIEVSTHNEITQQVTITVLKPKEAPVITHLAICPTSPYEGQPVTFDYDAIFDEERGAELVEERWTNKQSTYSTTGLHTVGLEVLDSNGLWSEKVELTFEVRPTSNIRVKTGKTFTTLARSNEESVVRVKTDEGWVSLLTTSEISPVRVKVGGAWINIQIEK